jgi:hypothetical protein
MKRKLLIVALSLGTVGGFASGFMSLHCHAKARRHHVKQMVTAVCADAIRQAQTE